MYEELKALQADAMFQTFRDGLKDEYGLVFTLDTYDQLDAFVGLCNIMGCMGAIVREKCPQLMEDISEELSGRSHADTPLIKSAQLEELLADKVACWEKPMTEEEEAYCSKHFECFDPIRPGHPVTVAARALLNTLTEYQEVYDEMSGGALVEAPDAQRS
jgi:hypothetical protein